MNFVSYCPICGNKIDSAMTFCPNCGTLLKAQSVRQDTVGLSQPSYEYQYRNHRDEKAEKNEKSEKHEKQGGSYVGYLIGGLVIIFIGLLVFVNATTDLLKGPVFSAVFLVVIGIIIIVAGIYFAMRARQRNPVPT